jgi:hypothetical protein
MTIPGFDAEASLYKTSGHYRTGRQTIKLPTQMLRGISPAIVREGIDCSNCVGGECAELHCFEVWTHSGAGPEGPYQGPGEPPLFPNRGYPAPSAERSARLQARMQACSVLGL